VLTAAFCGAFALVVWPDRDALRRRRVTAVTGRGALVGRARVLRALPLPPSMAAIAGLVGALVSTPLVAVLGGVAGFLGARWWLSARADRQADGRLRSLADGLGALGADLRSGRTLATAVGAAAVACADDECGRALTTALRAPGAVPTGSADPELADALLRIGAAVALSARTGCSLAAVAGAVEDDLRARHRLRLELRAATAAPRASAALLAGLPVLGLAMGHGIGADPWGVLTGTGVGQVLLVAGTGLEAVGLAWSRRMIARAAP
jgi:tight adherence protein B